MPRNTKTSRAEAEMRRVWGEKYKNHTPKPYCAYGDEIASFSLNGSWPVDIFMVAFWAGYDFANKDARQRKAKVKK